MERINLAALDLNLLVVLDRLLATASVREAARSLHLSQPATSHALARLRDVLGDPLLVRQGRGLVPTARALALAVPVREAVAAARRVFEAPGPFDPAAARGEVRLALGDEAQAAFTDVVVRRLWARAPGLDVRVRRLTMDTIAEGRRGAVDLVVTPDLGPLPGGSSFDLGEFVARPLYRRRFVVVSSARHPRRSLDLAAYAAADHVIVSFDGTGRGFMDDLLAEHGLRRRVAAAVTSFHHAAGLVAATDLVATVPEEIAWTSPPGLVILPPPIPLPVLDMLLVWHPRDTADPRHQFLREVVEAAIRERVERWPASIVG